MSTMTPGNICENSSSFFFYLSELFTFRLFFIYVDVDFVNFACAMWYSQFFSNIMDSKCHFIIRIIWDFIFVQESNKGYIFFVVKGQQFYFIILGQKVFCDKFHKVLIEYNSVWRVVLKTVLLPREHETVTRWTMAKWQNKGCNTKRCAPNHFVQLNVKAQTEDNFVSLRETLPKPIKPLNKLLFS